MRKDAFIKELEYLLQDIPDEEREEAIAYYRDYLEEAGSDNEEKVIEEFGSPERTAALIRAEPDGWICPSGRIRMERGRKESGTNIIPAKRTRTRNPARETVRKKTRTRRRASIKEPRRARIRTPGQARFKTAGWIREPAPPEQAGSIGKNIREAVCGILIENAGPGPMGF